MPTFIDKLKSKWNEGKFVCVGLDTDFSKIPQFLKDKWNLKFNIWKDNQIGLLVESYPIFYKLVSDIIIPEMRYKLPKLNLKFSTKFYSYVYLIIEF